MNTEEHDELWHLLGKARQPTVSPLFSRNVLREVRNLRQERPGLVAWLYRHWLVATASACAAVILASTLPQFFRQEPYYEEQQALLAMAETVSESPDYQVIAHLDELLDSEESSIWLDGNTY